MLKRFSSLILALVIGSSVLAGTLRPSSGRVCKMVGMGSMPGVEMMDHGMEMMPGREMPTAPPSLSASHELMPGMEMMPGMETMPCCKKHGTQSVSSESGPQGQCCVDIPHETGSSPTTFDLRLPSFNIVGIHPAVVGPPMIAPKLYEWSYSPEVFVPNLRASYIRNHSFLI